MLLKKITGKLMIRIAEISKRRPRKNILNTSLKLRLEKYCRLKR
jgi:hypothetical protein